MSPDTDHPSVWLYVSGVTVLGGATIALIYGIFASGFTRGVEAFLADPSGTLLGNLGGVLAVVAVFVALFAIFAFVVGFGAQYAAHEPDTDN